MKVIIVVSALILSTASAAFADTQVNCSRGESVNDALGKLSKTRPHTVTVSGSCTEDIVVTGFDELALVAGSSGATLHATGSGSPSIIRVDASRRVTISGFSINGGQQQAIAFWDSLQVRVEGVTVTGGQGIRFQRNSTGEVVDSRVQDVVIGLLAGNASTVFVRGTVIEKTTAPRTGTGMFAVGYATIVLDGVTLSGFATGVSIGEAVVSVTGPGFLGSSRPNLIENNNVGVLLNPSGTLSLFGGTLTVTNNGSAGSPAGNFSGGIVLDRATLTANPFTVLSVDGNVAQGIVAANQSVIEVAGGANVSNNQLNGVAVVNDSLVEFRSGLSGAKVTVSGNGAQDVFCAGDSMMRGGSHVIGATKVQCTDQRPSRSEALPPPTVN